MKKKIFRYILLVAGIVLLASLLVIIAVMYDYFGTVEEQQLESQLGLAVTGVEKYKEEYLKGIDGSKYRITWVDKDGTVLYDTLTDAATMENHGDREEIRKALESAEGKSQRYSTTLLEKTLYYAQRLSDGTVLRISVSHASAWILVLGMIQPIILILIIALVVSAIAASRLSRRIIEPFNKIDLDNPLENETYDEITPLLARIDRQHRQIKAQIGDLIKEQSASEKMRIEFTANVTHELKTPLQSIMGSAELIENGLVKENDMPRFTGHIRTEAERLLALINDIIRLAQLDEGGELPFEDVELTEIAWETAGILRPQADSRNITINVEGEPCTVHTVRRLVSEVVYNLCDNAVKYNKDGGQVDIIIGDREITVKDTGIGIPEEHQARVFERFYRVDKSHSRESGGTGLGLSIVKHAVQYLGGTIELKSEPGQGTEIRI
ncbi:MAG: PAS domain-containing sensor histidine kinase, partial [Parasporobacterium sp.]|nr:PAS domain-containing sensor histidine kinase [Parasporobacterium sp.]